MHYYQFNIADYRKDTGHLSPIEHYIYRSLLDCMYLNEIPIPTDNPLVLRRLGLGSEYEKELKNVFTDFFELTEKGYIQSRVMNEIEEYKAFLNKQSINGKKGGRTKKQEVTRENNPKKTTAFPNKTQHKPKKSLTTNHKPLTTNHRDIYIPVFNFWNSQKIIQHKGMTKEICSAISSALKKMKELEASGDDEAVAIIKQAIQNYAKVLHSEQHYFDHKWTLKDFLKRGLDRFFNEADPLNNFLRKEFLNGKMSANRNIQAIEEWANDPTPAGSLPSRNEDYQRSLPKPFDDEGEGSDLESNAVGFE